MKINVIWCRVELIVNLKLLKDFSEIDVSIGLKACLFLKIDKFVYHSLATYHTYLDNILNEFTICSSIDGETIGDTKLPIVNLSE